MIGCDSTAKRLIAALLAASLLAGCSHVRPADPTAAGVDLDDINARLAGRMVRVRLADGREMIAHDVRVSAESVFFRPERFPDLESPWPAREERELPVSEVHSIEVTRRSWGAADGALIGSGIGVVAGAAIGVAVDQADEASIWSTETAALVGGGVFGVLGMAVGLIIGVGLGSTEVFDLTKAPLAVGSTSASE
jgi:uncharacterized protein YcfJ